MMRRWLTPKACAAWMYSSSLSFSASPRSSRHRPVQLVTPRMMHRNSSRKSARAADGREQLRVRIDIDLHHQHRRGDQQHAGNRVERRVDVLDHVVDPAAEIAGHDAERDGERQHHQRGQRADHEPGADALQRLVEHVLADLVGAEHVVVRGSGRPPLRQSASIASSVRRMACHGTFISPRQIRRHASPMLGRSAAREQRASSVASSSQTGRRRRYPPRCAGHVRRPIAPGFSRCAPP